MPTFKLPLPVRWIVLLVLCTMCFFEVWKQAAVLILNITAIVAFVMARIWPKIVKDDQGGGMYTLPKKPATEGGNWEELAWPDHPNLYVIHQLVKFLDRKTVDLSSLLGIFGMRGMGKTTLLRDMHYLCTHHASPLAFDHVFLLGAGAGCTMGRVQHVLSVYLGLPPPHHTSDVHPKLAKDIHASLKQKTFLLLLDDVYESLDLEAVGLPMPLGHNQKVIFTARNQAVCAEMGCTSSNIMQMRCWDEDAAWNLFKDRVGDQVIDAHPHIKPIAKKMASECRGLPSALDALGGFMSITTDIREWRYVYGVLKTMRSSTDEIQEVDDQESFLYCLEEALKRSFL